MTSHPPGARSLRTWTAQRRPDRISVIWLLSSLRGRGKPVSSPARTVAMLTQGGEGCRANGCAAPSVEFSRTRREAPTREVTPGLGVRRKALRIVVAEPLNRAPWARSWPYGSCRVVAPRSCDARQASEREEARSSGARTATMSVRGRWRDDEGSTSQETREGLRRGGSAVPASVNRSFGFDSRGSKRTRRHPIRRS